MSRFVVLFLSAAILVSCASKNSAPAPVLAPEPTVKIEIKPAPSEGPFDLRAQRVYCMKKESKTFYFRVTEEQNAKGLRRVDKADPKFLPEYPLESVKANCYTEKKGITCRFNGKHPLKVASLIDVRKMRKSGWGNAETSVERANAFSSQARARGNELSCYFVYAQEDVVDEK